MNVLLRIASWLYGLAVGCRNILYDHGLLRSHEPELPCICVGNLAVGGTGKTPHVEYIVGLLRRSGYHVAVLSRGYKRTTRGYHEADIHSTTRQVGDEAMQMKTRHPEVTVAVCEDRVAGIKTLKERHPELQVVVLDDAFQHRRLKAGLNILLTQADRLYVEDELLPLGRLREPKRGCYRANMVVVTKCPDSMRPIEQRIVNNKLVLPPSKPLVFTRIKYLPPVPVFESEYPSKSPFKGDLEGPQLPLLLTGIAQPQYIHAEIKRMAGEVVTLTFPDHHAFTSTDIKHIQDTFLAHGCRCIITTEKDAVRLRECASFPKQLIPLVFALPIEVEFLGEDEQTFNNTILHYVRKSTTDR